MASRERTGPAAVSTSEAGYKWLVLIIVGMGSFMSALDGSIVSIAIPLIREQYMASVSDVSWVSAAYLLVISSLLLSTGRLGDMLGFKGVYSAGYIIFGLGSLLCGLSPSLPALIGARVVQGMGAAILMAIGPALITTSFPGSQRGRALGLQATLTYSGLTIGPSLGGWIAGQFGWHWVFLINVPIAITGAVLALTRLRPSGSRARQAFDLAGALLFTLGLTSLLLALNEAETWGWGSAATLGLILTGLALLTLFVWHEGRTAHPMLPLSLFRVPSFSGGVGAALLQYAASFMLSFLLPFYLQEFRGLAPSQAGAVMTVQPLAMVAVAALAGWLADRVGTRLPATAGMISTAVGLWFIGHSGAATPLALTMLFLGLVGLGNGLFVPPNNSSIMGSAPRERQGVASALLAAARNVGMVTGIALSSALFSLLRSQAETAGAAEGAAFLPAFRGTLLAAVGMAAFTALLSLVRPSPPRQD